MRRTLVATLAVMCVAAAGIGAVIAPASERRAFDLDCPDFATQAAAQYYMNAHPGDPDGLDGNDHDGRACESNPCPCYYGTATQPEAPTPTPTPTPEPTPDAPRATRYTARVVEVIDGDTLNVRLAGGSRRTVRLVGIDTPESRKPGVPVECGAKRATRHMKRLAFQKRGERRIGRIVALITDPTQDGTDRYGRLLAYVDRRPDGKDLGRSMIRAGWTQAYVYDNRPFERVATYSDDERRAESADRGVWAMCAGDFHSEQ
jgi:endonuclease YncB( thermonuclease family)